MFTGIIETIGTILDMQQQGSNCVFTIQSYISNELKADQSVAHDGVCLTVVSAGKNQHTIIAVEETLLRTNLSKRKVGDVINLERCMKADARFDGHIVQGHVDGVAIIKKTEDKNGSRLFTFKLKTDEKHLIVEKGSVCVNGVSLTVAEAAKKKFSAAIIPYTYEHTNFQFLKEGDEVNIEFDILGKYIAEWMKK